MLSANSVDFRDFSNIYNLYLTLINDTFFKEKQAHIISFKFKWPCVKIKLILILKIHYVNTIIFTTQTLLFTKFIKIFENTKKFFFTLFVPSTELFLQQLKLIHRKDKMNIK